MNTISAILVFGLITVLVFATFAPVVTCVILRSFSVMLKWAYNMSSKIYTDIATKLVKYTTLIVSRVIEVVNRVITWVFSQYSIFVDCILCPNNQ